MTTTISPAGETMVSPAELVDRVHAVIEPDMAAAYVKTPAVLDALAREYKKDIVVVTRVANNPCTGPATLTMLAKDKHLAVRSNVASNSNTPSELLAEFAGFPQVFIRKSVAANWALPHDIAATLARTAETEVRIELVINPNVDRELLAFDDLDSLVEAAVAYITDTRSYTLDELKALFKHPTPQIAKAAKRLRRTRRANEERDDPELERDYAYVSKHSNLPSPLVEYYSVEDLFEDFSENLDVLVSPVTQEVAAVVEALASSYPGTLPELVIAATGAVAN